jgi:FG-GAP repeat
LANLSRFQAMLRQSAQTSVDLAGSVYLYQRDRPRANKWGLLSELHASNGVSYDFFGAHVAIARDILVVGAPGHSSFAGAAYVFQRNRGGINRWGEVKQLAARGSTYFGSSVAVSGDTIVIGAGLTSSDMGAAYVFQRNQNGLDAWGLVKTLQASDAAAGDLFGSVAISGDMIVVGANGKSNGAGAAYVFERGKGGRNTWGEVTKVVASDPHAGAGFGSSTAASGDVVVVGAFNANQSAGAAYIYGRDSGGRNNFGQLQKLGGSDVQPGDQFGGAVAICDDIVLVGAWGTLSRTGAAYLFGRSRSGSNRFGRITRISAPDAAVNDQFGAAIATTSSTGIIGAPVKDSSVGKAYILRYRGP